VSIVEDDRTTREGLATLVGGATGCICVGTYGSVEDALQVQPGGLGDVVLLDVNLPGIPGSEGARFIREHQPSTEVLMLTAFADDDKVFRSICNGAVVYLLKKTPASKLLVAMFTVSIDSAGAIYAAWCGNAMKTLLAPSSRLAFTE
jgi:DNA-binding NarL/FixJ family response regulator